MFKRSPLEYYFHKILQEEPEKINSVYGDAGTAVHEGLRAYIETGNGEDKYIEYISKVGQKGMHGESIKFDKFRECFEEGKKIVDEYKTAGYELIPELEINFKEQISGVEVNVKGFIDLVMKRGNEVIILDWKTNTSLPEDGFTGQQRFYTYLYYKQFGIIPNSFVWVMLKNGNKIQHTYNIDTVQEIETEIKDFVDYILLRGYDVSKYEEKDYEHIFNEHFTSCRHEVARRKKQTILNVEIYRNQLIFTNLKDLRLRRAMDLKFSYHPEGYEFSPKYQAGEWDGKIRFLKSSDVKNESGLVVHTDKLPIGFYWMIQDFVDAYNKRFDLNYIFHFVDKRNRKVQGCVYDTTFGEPPFELRYYQKEAVACAIDKKIGIIYSSTASGKSAMIAEFCKQVNKRTLIIINRLELIDQTIEAMEEFLGVKIGKMTEGNIDINNQFTVASVQTIDAILKRNDKSTVDLVTYLFNVNAILYDECQNVKDKSFYSKILEFVVNTDFIIGFSGSPWRVPEQETLSMNSMVGDIIYTKTSAELEKEGFVVPAKCYFIRPNNSELRDFSGSYQEVYEYYIINNSNRNNIIFDLVKKYRSGNKIMILTKYRKHGAFLQENISNSILINSFTPIEERRKLMKRFRDEDDVILIASTQIAQAGLNFPTLSILINASCNKSSITTIQSIGRVKRKYKDKKFGYFIDFFDGDADTLRQASKHRMEVLEKHKNDVDLVYKLEDFELPMGL